MLRKLWTACLSTAALSAVAATLFFTLTPQAIAQEAFAAETIYTAGNLTPGTNICNCPILAGNCVCAITPPAPTPVPRPGGDIAVAAH